MFAVDTNIFLYAANRDSSFHDRAVALVRQWRHGPEIWCTTWNVVYEFLRTSTHRGAFPTPLSFEQAWSFVEEVRASRSFQILSETDRHPQVVADLIGECPWAAGNLMHDLHTAALMREHGIKEIRTADSDFLKFRFLRVVNPLRE